MEMDDNRHVYVPHGNPVEVSLLKYLTELNTPVHEKLVERKR